MTLQILDVILCQVIPGFASTCLFPCAEVCNASKKPLEHWLQYLKAQPSEAAICVPSRLRALDDVRVESHGLQRPPSCNLLTTSTKADKPALLRKSPSACAWEGEMSPVHNTFKTCSLYQSNSSRRGRFSCPVKADINAWISADIWDEFYLPFVLKHLAMMSYLCLWTVAIVKQLFSHIPVIAYQVIYKIGFIVCQGIFDLFGKCSSILIVYKAVGRFILS